MEILPEVQQSWSRQDIEQRFGFNGGRFTRVNNWLSGLAAAILTVTFYAALIPLSKINTGTKYFCDMFTEQGAVPYAICLLAAWSMWTLFIKSRKLAFQRESLNHIVVPSDHDFVLSAKTVDEVTDRIFSTVDDPKHFVVFNRILVALSNLRNLGRVSDVDDILRSQASQDESSMETSYAVISGFVWAIPVLGFIGTVLGLSAAIFSFGNVLQAGSSDFEEIKSALTDVTGGLGEAFITTLLALVAALIIQLFLTFLKKSEEEFLDECSEYCTRNIVNKLRIMPYQSVQDED